MKRTATVILPVLLLLVTAPAWAQQASDHSQSNVATGLPADPEGGDEPSRVLAHEARARFDRGLALLNEQDYNGAYAEFQASYDISHRPTILYNIGVAHQGLHQYPEAARAIEQYLRDATLTPERRSRVERGLAELRAFIAHVAITGLPEGAAVRIDGRHVGSAPIVAPIAVGAGQHVIDVHADGFDDAQERFIIAGGQTRAVHFVMHATTVGSGAAVVLDVPRGALVEIDGQPRPSAHPITVEPGEHTVRVTAIGYAPWSGRVSVRPGMRRMAHVHMVRAGRWGPAPFGVGLGITLACGIGAAIVGGLTLVTSARFGMLLRDDPMAQTVANEGNTERAVTNVLLGATVLAAATTLIFLTRTSFSGTESTVDVAVAPRLEGGAEGAVRVRF